MTTPGVPCEIISRLQDVGCWPASSERIAEECRYVAQMLREGGSNYDDSPKIERNRLLRQCERYVKFAEKK